MRGIWIQLLAYLSFQPAPLPEKPSERFTIFVELAKDAVLAPGQSPEQLLKDVAGAMGKRKKWLFLTKSSDRAEVFVRILGYRVRREHDTLLRTRVRYAARRERREDVQAIDFIDVNRLNETHYILAEARGLGFFREMVGFAGKEGASRKRAASELAKELEGFLKQNYWDLDSSRRQVAAQGLAAQSPTLEASRPRLDPFIITYLDAVETCLQGSFEEAAGKISPLTASELYAASNYFLASDRSAAELKAAALLHTPPMARPASTASSPIARARRTAIELGIAKRYSQAIPDTEERERFQKQWHLASAYYFHTRFRSTEAISLLASGLQQLPGDLDLLYALAAVQEASAARSGKNEGLVEAEMIYRLLLATQDPPDDVRIRLSHVALRSDRLEEAREWLERAELGFAPDDRPLAFFMVKGRLAAERGDWAAARELFEAASRKDPACQACIVALADSEQRLGNRDLAGQLVAEWLTAHGAEGRDGWWKFLIGPAAGYDALLRQMRSESFPR